MVADLALAKHSIEASIGRRVSFCGLSGRNFQVMTDDDKGSPFLCGLRLADISKPLPVSQMIGFISEILNAG